MTFRSANDLIFTRFCWRCECSADGSTRLNLHFQKHVGHVFLIEPITGSRTQLHNNEIMYHRAIVHGIEGDFLPGWDGKLIGLKLKVGHGNVDRGGSPSTAAEC